MFMVLSLWQSHCESSPGSFDEYRTAPSGRRLKTKPTTQAVSPPVQAARVYTDHRHLLSLLSPKADAHFTVPQMVESCVDLVTYRNGLPSTDGHTSWY